MDRHFGGEPECFRPMCRYGFVGARDKSLNGSLGRLNAAKRSELPEPSPRFARVRSVEGDPVLLPHNVTKMALMIRKGADKLGISPGQCADSGSRLHPSMVTISLHQPQ